MQDRSSTANIQAQLQRQSGSVDAVDDLGYGPELQAANAGQFDMLAALLKPTAKGGFGRTPPKDQLQIYPYNADNACRVMTIQHSRIAPTKCETLTLLDLQTATTESYKLGKLLGFGNYGSVYCFQSGGKKIAVKVPQNTWSEYEGGDSEFVWKEAQHEFDFLCQAYPDEGPYALQSLRKHQDGKIFYSWRMMMPFVSGENISAALQDVNDPVLAATIILRAAEELQKMHAERDLSHGDIRPGNILIDKTDKVVRAHLVDFDFAYPMSGFSEYALCRDKYLLVPPERYLYPRLKAHPSQDIWSLGRTFDLAMSEALKITMQLFPSVSKFIKDAAEEDPEKRPSLPAFITALSQEINVYTDRQKYVRNNRFFLEDQQLRKFKQDIKTAREFNLRYQVSM